MARPLPMADLVPAVGGARLVPSPDPVARDYILLALRLDQHVPGLVDGYYGPASLKAQVDLEQGRSAAALHDDAAALRARLPAEVADPGRRRWLDVQLVALETQAEALAGHPRPYLEQVSRCFAYTPPRWPDATFDAAAATLETLLPGDGPLDQRLEAWDEALTVPLDRLEAVVAWLVETFRARAKASFGLPEGEDLRVSLVHDQPWSGYNWYDGGRRSRVDINTDLPVRLPDLVSTVAHETYPGHHLEHAWKEADLVDRDARLEASILLINTPECLISEGLADLGRSFAAPLAHRADLFVEGFERAGLADARDRAAARDVAERAVALAGARETLRAARGNAAILRHADGRSHADVVDYLRTVGRIPESAVAKRLEFIEHPLWRTYVFVYAEGEALLRRWLDAVPEAEQTARFGRLLHEGLTPLDVTVGAPVTAAGVTAPAVTAAGD